jgi:type II secretory pathway component PulF
VFMQIYMARTMRVMSTSMANGVTVLDTLAACRDAIANREFQQFLSRVEEHVVQGKGFAAAFNADASLPALVRDMISTGEQTGKLAMVMARIADFYERELMRRVMAMSKLAEPVMLLVMGGVVGVIVMSLILPIFKLSKAAG